ncbi:MAG: DUF6531 domain-containing protein [Treponema sp.]|nr:DUF6531 domain-containing protein [Treponema sp.]
MIASSVNKKAAFLVLLFTLITALVPVSAKEVGCAYCTSSCSICKPSQPNTEDDEKKKAEEEAKRKAEEEARKKAEEEARKRAEEEARRRAEEAAVNNAEDQQEKSQEFLESVIECSNDINSETEQTVSNSSASIQTVQQVNNGVTYGDPVLIASGKYVLDSDDIEIPGSSFIISRKYISEENISGSMGAGWLVSLDSRIIRGISALDDTKFNGMETLVAEILDAHGKISGNYAQTVRIKNNVYNNIYIPAKGYLDNLRTIKNRANTLKQLNRYSDFLQSPDYFEGAGNENLVLVDESGSPFTFNPSDSGIWLPVKYPERSYMRLESLDNNGAGSTAGFVLSERGGRKKYYNGYGMLTKVEELNGNTVEITRNNNQKISLIKGPHGNEWHVTYSGNYISKITGPENTKVEYKYSGNELRSVQDIDGDTVRFTYNSGHLQRIQKPDGSAIILNYGTVSSDGRLLVTSTTHEEEASESFSYYPDQMMTVYTNHSGVRTRYYYDINFRTIREEHSDGTVKEFIYNDRNQLEKETINGFRINYLYDARGNLAEKIYSDDGTRESFEWNNNDQMKKYTDRDRVVTAWDYDSAGNCIRLYRGGTLIFSGSYDETNRLAVSREGDLAEVSYRYNSLDLPVNRSVSISGQTLTETWEYDGLGRVTKYTDALMREWMFSYNQKETTEITPEGLTRRYVYNNRKDLTMIEETDTKTGTVRKRQMDYDRRHLPLKVTDGTGTAVNYTYRADGQMIRQQTGAWFIEYGYREGDSRVNTVTHGKTGSNIVHTETYGYERNGWNEERTVSVSGVTGASVYQINPFMQLTGIRNALGELSARTVNASGNPVMEQGASGGYYSYKYDAGGRVIEAGRANETAVSVIYNRDGSIAKKTDRLGNVTMYEYDGRGLVTREISSLGEYRFSHDRVGRLIRKEIISRNNSSYYTDWIFNDNDRTVIVTAGGKYRETLYLNAWGEVIKSIDGEGNERRYEYNGAGRLVKSFDGYNRATQYAWNEIGKISVITYSDGSMERYEYDHLGNVTEIKDSIGVKWSGVYDRAGRLIKETGRPGIEKEYQYDELGRITEVKSGDETVERYRYTNRGREVVFTDGAGKNFTQQKNQFGELTAEINRAGDTQRFYYDAEGRITTTSAYSGRQTVTGLNEAEGLTIIRYSDGTVSKFERDFAGNIIRAENETGIISYKYDAGGMLIEQNDTGAGEVTIYTYDRAGRLVRMQSGNRDVHYRYGNNGELLRVFDNSQRLEVSYEYDTRGREKKRQYGNGVWQETMYDLTGRIIMIRELNSRSQLLRAEGYLYDNKGRRSHSVDEEGRITKFIYDSQSRLSMVLYPWTNEKAQADRKEASDAGLFFTQDKGAGERYTFTSAELIALKEILDKAAPARGNAISASQIMWRETYTYDRNGNRSGKTTPWGTIKYEYDAENHLVRRGDIVYTNDKDGNVLSEKGLRYEAKYQYNGQNRMIFSEVTSHTERINTVSSYRYDALGRRTITENVSGQMLRTVYDGRSFDVIREGETYRDGSLTTQNVSGGFSVNENRLQSNQPTGERYRWVSDDAGGRTINENGYTVQEGRYNLRGVTLYANGEAVASSYSSSSGSRSLYLGKDILGSVRSSTAASGALEDRYEYDAFGQPYSGDLSAAMNLGYTGKPYDTATGLYNYGYRDYKPQTARFTTIDPIRDGNNWFVFVNNDPVNWVDLWGLEANDKYQSNYSISKRAWNLMVVQTLTRLANMYKQGGGGRYPSGAPGAYATFCNQATFDIAEATGFNKDALYNDKKRDSVNANSAAKNLAKAAENGTIIQIDGGKAQELANKGYTVIAAWENTSGGSGHLATITPNYPSNVNYSNDYDPWVSNVGTANVIMRANSAFAGNTPIYYYDPNQMFDNYSLSGVTQRKE